MKTKPNTTYSTYGIRCPFTNEMMYIGQSKGYEGRCKNHIFNCLRLGTPKDYWLSWLILQGELPIFEEIDSGLLVTEINDRETSLIKSYDNLTNIVDNDTPNMVYKEHYEIFIKDILDNDSCEFVLNSLIEKLENNPIKFYKTEINKFLLDVSRKFLKMYNVKTYEPINQDIKIAKMLCKPKLYSDLDNHITVNMIELLNSSDIVKKEYERLFGFKL